jgi:hypothetical protein
MWSFARLGLERLRFRWLFIGVLLFVILCWWFRLYHIESVGYTSATYPDALNFVSDDVSWQNFLWNWQHHGISRVELPTDNFILHWPVYLVANNLPVSPVRQIEFASFVLLAVTAALILWAYARLSRLLIRSDLKQRIAFFATGLLLAALPIEGFYYLKLVNARNIETGIFVVLLTCLYEYLRDQDPLKNISRAKLFAALILFSLLLVSDPIWLYLAVAPLLIVVATHLLVFRSQDKKLLWLSGFALIGAASAFIIRAILTLLLPISWGPIKFAFSSFDVFYPAAQRLAATGPKVFGTDLWGRDVASISTLLVLLFIASFILSMVTLVTMCLKKGSARLFATYLLVLFLWVTSIISLTTSYNYYLLPLAFILPIGLMFAFSRLVMTRQAVALSAGVTAIFLITFITEAGELKRPKLVVNAGNLSTIESISKTGLRKGYGNYWNGQLDNILSGHSLNTVSTICSHGRLYYEKLLTVNSQLSTPSSGSYYLYDPKSSLDCGPKELETQFGEPRQTLHIGELQLFLYDFDLGTKLEAK